MPVQIMVERFVPGGVPDGYGGFEPGWSPPEVVDVFGWAPAGSTEPKTVGENRVIVSIEVFAPFPLQAKDKVTISGKLYDVIGEPEDWNHGPYGHQPGYVINLKRIDG